VREAGTFGYLDAIMGGGELERFLTG
jgi:hypothetical protein